VVVRTIPLHIVAVAVAARALLVALVVVATEMGATAHLHQLAVLASSMLVAEEVAAAALALAATAEVVQVEPLLERQEQLIEAVAAVAHPLLRVLAVLVLSSSSTFLKEK